MQKQRITAIICAFCIAAASINPVPVRAEIQITELDRSVRDQDIDIIREWYMDMGIAEDETEALYDVCTRMTFVRLLWMLSGSEIADEEPMFEDVEGEENINAAAWAARTGLAYGDMFFPEQPMTHETAINALWWLDGHEEPSRETMHYFTGISQNDPYYPSLCWAADRGMIIKEEQENYNPLTVCTVEDVIRYIYYEYNIRQTNPFPITVDEFLQSCQDVTDFARTHGYRYGSSSAADPTTDGITSCDRLVAKALYDLGFTDQPRGGITVGNMADYLRAWGFEESRDPASIRRGSILLVRHGNHADKPEGHYCHAFVVVDFDPESWRTLRYDHGSNGRIQSVQPIECGWGYVKDQIAVFNIPA